MKLTPEKLTAFCAALAETGIVAKACKAVDISRVTAYQWREDVPEFAAAWDKALKVGITALEDEAHRRAFEGCDEPLTHQGQVTYKYERDEHGQLIFDSKVIVDREGKEVTIQQPRLMLDENRRPMVESVKKYSDTLAIFLLKAHAPEKYRERTQMDVSNADGSLTVDDATRSARVAQLLAIAQQRKEAESEFGDLA